MKTTVPANGSTPTLAAAAITVSLALIGALATTSAADPSEPASASATPKGKVAFGSDRVGGQYHIFVMNPNGTNQVGLDPTGNLGYDPGWDSSGRRIAYHDDTTGHLAIMNADGTNPHQLDDGGPGINDYSPVFTPDGRWILFYREGDVWAQRPAGTGAHALTSASEDEKAPDPSPDGKRIVYLREDASTYQQIWMMNSNGSNQHQVTTGDTDKRSPKFSPDGRSMIYTEQTGANAATNEIFVSRLNGTGAVQVTDNAFNDRGAAFSRDGLQRIYFVSNRDGNDNIWAMNRSGGGPVQLTDATGYSLSPAPQPVVSCAGRKATIIGTAKSEKLVGGPGPDVIAGLGGKDTIIGAGANDRICGGPGKDRLLGGQGRDILLGGPGNDVLIGGPGRPDRCVGGPGRRDRNRKCERGRA